MRVCLEAMATWTGAACLTCDFRNVVLYMFIGISVDAWVRVGCVLLIYDDDINVHLFFWEW